MFFFLPRIEEPINKTTSSNDPQVKTNCRSDGMEKIDYTAEKKTKDWAARNGRSFFSLWNAYGCVNETLKSITNTQCIRASLRAWFGDSPRT